MNGDPDPGRGGRWIGRLMVAERLASAGLLASILGTMASQVLARYVLGSPIAWSEEWARFALIWMAFLAAALVMAEGGHIAVDVVSSRMNALGKLRLEYVSTGVVVGASLLLLAGGFRFVWRVGLVSSPALGIPMSWWYGAASAGLGLIALHGTWNLVAAFRRGRPVWDERAAGDEQSPSGGGCAG